MNDLSVALLICAIGVLFYLIEVARHYKGRRK